MSHSRGDAIVMPRRSCSATLPAAISAVSSVRAASRPVGRDDAVLDAHPGGFRTVVGHQRPHLDRGPFSRDFGGREVDARRCEVGWRHVHLVGHQQAHVAVDAAEEGEVGGQGRNIGIVGVVHLCGEEVFAARDDVFRDVEHEARVAARVLPGVMAVDVEPHHLVGPSKQR